MVPDLDPADLTTDGLGKHWYKLDDPGVFVRCRNILHMVLKLLFEGFARLIIPAKHHRGLDHLASDVIGRGRNGTLDHRGVRDQGALDLEGTDPVAGAFYDVVGPADEPEEAFFVHPGHVARIVVAIMPDRRSSLFVTVIAVENAHGDPFDGINDDLALFAHFAGFSPGVEKLDAVAR